MPLNREFLNVLSLSQEDADRILQAHEEAVSALQDAHHHTLDELQGRCDTLKSEYDAYRAQVEQQRHDTLRRTALHEALRQCGANEQAIPLLALAASPREEDWQEDALRDPDAVLAPVKSTYAAFFCPPIPLPTERIAPPLHTGGMLTGSDLRSMSPDEINRQWSQVRQALGSL